MRWARSGSEIRSDGANVADAGGLGTTVGTSPGSLRRNSLLRLVVVR